MEICTAHTSADTLAEYYRAVTFGGIAAGGASESEESQVTARAGRHYRVTVGRRGWKVAADFSDFAEWMLLSRETLFDPYRNLFDGNSKNPHFSFRFGYLKLLFMDVVCCDDAEFLNDLQSQIVFKIQTTFKCGH